MLAIGDYVKIKEGMPSIIEVGKIVGLAYSSPHNAPELRSFIVYTPDPITVYNNVTRAEQHHAVIIPSTSLVRIEEKEYLSKIKSQSKDSDVIEYVTKEHELFKAKIRDLLRDNSHLKAQVAELMASKQANVIPPKPLC